MKAIVRRFIAILPVAAGLYLSSIGLAEEAPPAPNDPGWPREFTMESKKLTIYQPQVDEGKDHSTMQQATRQSLDSMSRSRERGSVQTQRTQSCQRSAPSGDGARSGGSCR